MRVLSVAVLAIAGLLASVRSQAADCEAKEETVKKDLLAFKGTWRLISREVDGKKSSEEWIKDVTGTNDGSGKFCVRRGDKVIAEATTELDPTKKPKTIDVRFTEGKHKGKTVLGIYEIDGDTFRVCVARPGAERPAKFSAKAGSGCTLVVYKREQK
jgi:uncharacterized protein (TIGR03067 family)